MLNPQEYTTKSSLSYHILFKGQVFGLFRLHNSHLFLERPTSLLLLRLHSKEIIGMCDPTILSKCFAQHSLLLSVFAIIGVMFILCILITKTVQSCIAFNRS
jgi:hypothetical protein